MKKLLSFMLVLIIMALTLSLCGCKDNIADVEIKSYKKPSYYDNISITERLTAIHFNGIYWVTCIEEYRYNSYNGETTANRLYGSYLNLYSCDGDGYGYILVYNSSIISFVTGEDTKEVRVYYIELSDYFTLLTEHRNDATEGKNFDTLLRSSSKLKHFTIEY